MGAQRSVQPDADAGLHGADEDGAGRGDATGGVGRPVGHLGERLEGRSVRRPVGRPGPLQPADTGPRVIAVNAALTVRYSVRMGPTPPRPGAPHALRDSLRLGASGEQVDAASASYLAVLGPDFPDQAGFGGNAFDHSAKPRHAYRIRREIHDDENPPVSRMKQRAAFIRHMPPYAASARPAPARPAASSGQA